MTAVIRLVACVIAILALYSRSPISPALLMPASRSATTAAAPLRLRLFNKSGRRRCANDFEPCGGAVVAPIGAVRCCADNFYCFTRGPYFSQCRPLREISAVDESSGFHGNASAIVFKTATCAARFADCHLLASGAPLICCDPTFNCIPIADGSPKGKCRPKGGNFAQAIVPPAHSRLRFWASAHRKHKPRKPHKPLCGLDWGVCGAGASADSILSCCNPHSFKCTIASPLYWQCVPKSDADIEREHRSSHMEETPAPVGSDRVASESVSNAHHRRWYGISRKPSRNAQVSSFINGEANATSHMAHSPHVRLLRAFQSEEWASHHSRLYPNLHIAPISAADKLEEVVGSEGRIRPDVAERAASAGATVLARLPRLDDERMHVLRSAVAHSLGDYRLVVRVHRGDIVVQRAATSSWEVADVAMTLAAFDQVAAVEVKD